MRMLSIAAGAAFILLAAGPAMAGDKGGRGGCGGGCGGHRPPPPPPVACCHGGNTNINVNVQASAHAQASAGASARSYLNARTWSGGSSRGAVGGGTIYVGGGGYGGDVDYAAGPVVYGELPLAEGRACAPAPFGYALQGFGRDIGAPARCDAGYDRREDRGGRYGYSERHEGWREESWREESYREERYAASSHEERREAARACDCDRGPAAYPPAYLPEEPAYRPAPPRQARPTPRPRPARQRPAQPPRQHYAQEPGERG